MPEGVNLKEFARVTSPLGYAEPEELAGLIAYIASDDAPLHDRAASCRWTAASPRERTREERTP